MIGSTMALIGLRVRRLFLDAGIFQEGEDDDDEDEDEDDDIPPPPSPSSSTSRRPRRPPNDAMRHIIGGGGDDVGGVDGKSDGEDDADVDGVETPIFFSFSGRSSIPTPTSSSSDSVSVAWRDLAIW